MPLYQGSNARSGNIHVFNKFSERHCCPFEGWILSAFKKQMTTVSKKHLFKPIGKYFKLTFLLTAVIYKHFNFTMSFSSTKVESGYVGVGVWYNGWSYCFRHLHPCGHAWVKSWLLCLCFSFPYVRLGGYGWWLKVMGCCHPCGKLGFRVGLLLSTWPAPVCCGYWRSETADGRALSLTLVLALVLSLTHTTSLPP